MTPAQQTPTVFEAGAVLFLTTAVFILDVLSPLGWTDWMLYFIPLALTLPFPGERTPFHFAAVATLLTAVGGYLSPGEIHLGAALFNRALGIIVMWAFTWLMVRQKKARALLAGAESARSQAESRRDAAVAARELAEASALGALHRESQIERELQLSSLRLESIIQSAMDAIITIDEQQRVLLFNQAAEEMFQCPAREALGQPLDRFLPVRSREAHREHIAAFGRSGITSRRMGRLGSVMGLRSDGREFPIEAAISHITVNGKHLYTVILRDIAERKRVEEALQESTERMSLLIKYAPAALAMFDRQMRYLAASQRWISDYGLQADHIIGRAHYAIFPDVPERWKAAHARGLVGEVVRMEEDQFTRADGSAQWLRWEVRPWHAADGSVGGIVIFTEDITERKQAERMMRQSEERYRRLISVSPLAIFVNRRDRVIFINDAGLRLFGAVRADEILGKSPSELFHPECHAMMKERIRHLLEGGAAVPVAEERIVKLDGTVIDVEVSAARFVDEEGPAIVAMIRDISEQKRLQEQLRRTERIAELGTVASGMAHEIGTPMNVILGRAEYLMERVKEEPIRKGLQTIVAQVERITKVMNQLLSFARRRTPERRSLDLKEVIEASVEIFQERLARNRITVDAQLDPACPPALADADQMNQVLINLIMNAVHAMADGGVLRIGLRPTDSMVELTVGDTGHGMPPEVAAHIFDPFFTTKEFGKGTGLGLTVVKGILEEHGGSITVASEPGKGTTFTMLLPTSA